MGKVIPFERRAKPSGSWDADMRVHSRDTCTKRKQLIVCEACEYGTAQGALFADEADYKAFEADMRSRRIFECEFDPFNDM